MHGAGTAVALKLEQFIKLALCLYFKACRTLNNVVANQASEELGLL